MKEQEEIDWTKTRKNLEDMIKLHINPEKNTDWIDEVLNLKKTKNDLFKSFIKGVFEWESLLKLAIEDEEFEVCTQIRKMIEIEKETMIHIIDNYYKGASQKDIDRLDNIVIKAHRLYFEEEK